MLPEIIILAGGLGTRLSAVLPDTPKCLAPIGDRPFLEAILQYLKSQPCGPISLALGLHYQKVESYLHTQNYFKTYKISVENTPLGTGGAIQLALKGIESDRVLILNGDTFFPIDFSTLMSFHTQQRTPITIALKEMENFDRYGTVHLSKSGFVQQFNEKKYCHKGLINGGIYLIETAFLKKLNLGDSFSFEKEILEKYTTTQQISGYTFDSYFLDIGIPEDYQKAQKELPNIINQISS